MAITKTTAGQVTTYVVSDVAGNTATVALTDGLGAGRTCTFSSVGNLRPDGQLQLTTLMQMVSTNLTP